jgi:lambda repressor-like predicted transcriptional regulator
MDKHYGQIVELVIRKKGVSISQLARMTNVNRRSVYNWFNQKYLKQEIIHQIGILIAHDFSVEFPELFRKTDFLPLFQQRPLNEEYFGDGENHSIWKDKYIELLEKYNILLRSWAESNHQS